MEDGARVRDPVYKLQEILPELSAGQSGLSVMSYPTSSVSRRWGVWPSSKVVELCIRLLIHIVIIILGY